MAKILIKNGKIWNGEKFFFGDVLTDGKLIADIGTDITETAEYVFDANGKIVSAGLVDSHVHLKGISSDRFGIQAEMCSLPFGVTAVNNAGNFYCNKTLLDSFAVKNTIFISVKLDDNHAVLESVEEKLECYGEKTLGLKVFFDNSGLTLKDITPLAEVCDYAKKRNLKVMVHCAHSPSTMPEIVRTLSSGDILTHIFHGGDNACTENDFEAIKIAKEKGIVMDSGFAGNVHTDFSVFKKAVKEGYLPDTISTDITCASAYKRGGKYGMTMCMSIARNAGMKEEDILKAVTATPAKVLGKDSEWGHLAVGRCADIAVFDYTDEGFDLTDKQGNRIQSDVGYRCVLTVADGQVVYRY